MASANVITLNNDNWQSEVVNSKVFNDMVFDHMVDHSSRHQMQLSTPG